MSHEQSIPNAHLLFPGKCPICSKHYESKDISILHRRQNVLSAHVNCKHCDSSAVIALITNLGFITTVGITTDLEKEDIEKFSKMDPIDADEVIQCYAEIQGKKL